MSVLRDLNISYEFWSLQSSSEENWKNFSTRKQVDQAWADSTVSLQDKIIYVKHKFEKEFKNISKYFFDTDNEAYGKCITLHHDRPLNGTTDFLEIAVSIVQLNFSRKIDIWFHQRGSEGFLSLGNFVGGVSMFVMETGSRLYFSLKKKVVKFNNDNCKLSETFQDHAKCLENSIRTKVKQKMRSDNLPCYMPYISHFVDEQADVCKRIDDLRQTLENISQTAESFITNSIPECPRPCLKEEFTVNLRSVPDISLQHSGSRIVFHVSFDEMNVELLEEYVLFDFGAIVGAVGGSLGLFLGFSFLDVSLATSEFIRSHIRRRSNFFNK